MSTAETMRRSLRSDIAGDQRFSTDVYGANQGFRLGGMGNRIGVLSGMPSVYQGPIQSNIMGLEPYQQLQYNTSQKRAGLMRLIGGIAGAYMSSERSKKKDIRKQTKGDEDKVLDMIADTDTYQYRYKDDSGLNPKYRGMMADEAPDEIVTPDGKHIDLVRSFGLLATATKGLARKVKALEGK
jgi:hypothetical protein